MSEETTTVELVDGASRTGRVDEGEEIDAGLLLHERLREQVLSRRLLKSSPAVVTLEGIQRLFILVSLLRILFSFLSGNEPLLLLLSHLGASICV
jgi:hypothetical protein